MSPSHCLELVNDSPLAGRMAVYLEDAEGAPGVCFPLVWQSLDCGPGRSVRLEWNEDFGLACGAAAPPGLIFSPGAIQPAGPGADSFLLGTSPSGPALSPAPSGPAPAAGSPAHDSAEYVPEDLAAGFVLSMKIDGRSPTLADLADQARKRPARPRPGPLAAPGRFQVLVEPGITAGLAAALCLAGRPALLCPAGPGQTLSFPARPRYGALFGSFDPGQVLDPDQMLMATALDFPGGSLRAVFRRDCTWETTPGER
jgi:hypothetical protein